ncbi:MAG: adenylate/guanylate cyclase domain-containing protein [Turneriella sp.]|nr:adenylate/guanylate cyclase domain-containing protein [Turneriella sp.]
MALYYYLLSLEVDLSPFRNLILWQAVTSFAVLFYYFFAESWITHIRLRLIVASMQGFLIGGIFGIGIYLQVPHVHEPYRIATVFTMIVGVTGAASFTFTVSPLTFLGFSFPFTFPIFYWLWASSPRSSGQILAVMVVPYFTTIFFLVLREYRRRVNLILTELQLKKEQERSEKLLLNIIPSGIANELKSKGRAEPQEYSQVTVLFTDFVGFTRISEKLTPRELVDELDKCFSYFDQVTEKYRLEKLKTIGDSFMCAGGLPTPNKTHAIDCCLAALEIQSFMNQMKEIKHQQGFDYWELRLGMNTGPLVAGVVGHKKFAYDVWGDTVNTASRLESSGVPGEINISRATYEVVKDLFKCEHRGQVRAKNKGDIDMYFLYGVKPGLSVNGEGRVPNEKFRTIYKRTMRDKVRIPAE